MRQLTIFLLLMSACSSSETPSREDAGSAREDAGVVTDDAGTADAGHEPLECFVRSESASGDPPVVLRSSGWFQHSNHDVELVFFPKDEPACCSTFTSMILGEEVGRPLVVLKLHEDGQGDYTILSDYEECHGTDDGSVECPAPFTGGAAYVPLNGPSIHGAGTLHVDDGGGLDSESITGTIDVTFNGGTVPRHFKATFNSLLCGYE